MLGNCTGRSGFIYTLFVVLVCAGTSIYAQSDETNKVLLARLERRNENLPQEKVYLHFDKPFYRLGDTVWFEGYIVNALNNIPSERSHLLYVELINNENQVYKTLQLPVSTGFAAGDFILPDSLKDEVYQIRAYTNWMRNFDSKFFFQKSMPIISTRNLPVEVQATGPYSIQFFPEGGCLVSGLTSTIGFSAIDQKGKGIQVSGKLVDELNHPVLEFHSGHAGIGAFHFTPSGAKGYTAIVNFPDSVKKQFKLPEVRQSGYLLSAENNGTDSLYIKLQTTPDLVGKKNMTFMPLSNGMPLFYMQTRFPDQQINITVPKSKLAGGIIQLTLLNERYEPVAERLVFNRYLHEVKINLTSLKSSYHKREKTEFVLQALDRLGKPVTGSFSIAVTNSGEANTDEVSATTLFSSLLLSADLPGSIEQPNYYFTSPSVVKDEEIDQFLLTQVWHRFAWKDILADKLPDIIYPAETPVNSLAKTTGEDSGPDKTIKLNEVAIKGKSSWLVNSHSANLNGPGSADQVVLPETLEKITDLSSLSFLLHGVMPSGRGFKLTSTAGTHTPDVLVLVDGVSGIDDVKEIPPRDIESIEFLKSAPYTAVYGIRGAGGVLLITTKKGEIKKNDAILKTTGIPFYAERQFYSPRYEKPEEFVKQRDVRTTVYWKPDVITGKDGKVRLSFYNNDVAGNYNIVIEGVTAGGELCRQVYSYKVE
jgi:TonB-dependent SusC/RagA subfamily outer membrane receptor